MKKLTQRSLDRMRQEMVLLSEDEQRKVVGGAGNCTHGVNENMMCPACEGHEVVSWESYFAQEEAGTWIGGWYWDREGKPCFAPASAGGSSNEKVTGYCEQHGSYIGTECHWIHNGGGDQYCGEHHYWYFENVGCRECRDQTATGFCDEHRWTWVVGNDGNNFCPDCITGTITGYCGDHDKTWRIAESENCPECSVAGVTGYCGLHEKKWKMSEHEFCPDCDVVVNFCDMHQKKWYIINGNIEECPDCAANRDNEDHNHTGNDNIGDLPINEHLIDGVDVNNSKHFTFNTSGYDSFDDQLKKILVGNSVIKAILSRFDNGYVHLTFGVGDVKGGQAETSYPSEESYHITFDKKYVDENGWKGMLESDNVGYDWSKVHTMDEALVVAVTHEALHAKHFAVYQESIRMDPDSIKGSVQFLLDQGYSMAFVNVFYFKDELGYWRYRDKATQEQNMENYIRDYEHSMIDAALKEYREEHK